MATMEIIIKGSGTQAEKAVNGVNDAVKKTEKSVKKLSQRFDAIAAKTKQVGDKMRNNLTLPIIGVVGASAKMAVTFDTEMTKIQTLVGLTRDQVDGMRKDVLRLGSDTGKSAAEMARGLFVITSAGLRGNDAINALEASAKASAQGLGDIADIARSVAGTVNAYGAANISASKATDILFAAARAGNFETSQLASALGRVLPFAKEAKASFEDTAGAIALLTRTNGDAAQSVTQVASLLRSFATPTKQTQDAFEKLGLSGEKVRKMIGEKGLVETLRMLYKATGNSSEQLGLLIGSSEGTSAALQILNADAYTLEETFGVTNKAVGLTEEGFQSWEKSMSGGLQKKLNDIGIAMVSIGESASVSGGFLDSLATHISNLAKWFGSLSPDSQRLALNFMLIVAAAGPLLKLFATLAPIIWKAVGALLVFVGSITVGTTVAIAGLIVAIGLLIKTWDTVIDFYAKGWENLFAVFQNATQSIKNIINGFASYTVSAFRSMWQNIINLGERARDRIIRTAEQIIGAVKRALSAASQLPGVKQIRQAAAAVGEATANVFHSGGVFRASTPGGAGMALLQDGERVVSRDQSRGMSGNSSSGNQVVVNQQGLFAGANIRMISRDDAKAVSEEIYAMTRSRLRAQGVYA
jgi:TP901 family phage tail tape measure protein